MSRTPFLAANWKMYKTVREAVAFVKEFRKLAENVPDVEIVVAPPFTALRSVAEAAHASNVGVAGQDLYWEREGAFTGEVSAAMLKDAGAEYVIIGHSERRRLFGETDQSVNRKLMAALNAQLTPIVCIGETLEERDGNQTLGVLDRQVKQGLDGLTADQIASLVVAYEPVWAIGTGRPATGAHATAAARTIRTALRVHGVPADDIRVLYGGSVTGSTAREFASADGIDGALVGGASLRSDDFAAIARAFSA
jgi:triosephosphate isomerase (TIM)